MKRNERFKLDICYIVSHGFAARMIMQTGLLAKLSQNGLKVGLIAPDSNDENLSSFCEKYEVKLFEYNLNNQFWSENYWVKRRYILEDIKANPALWEKHLRAINIKKNKSKHPWRHIRPRLYYWLNQYAQKNEKFKEQFKKKEQQILTNKKASNFINEVVATKILVSTYPVNLQEAILLHAANQNSNILTVIHLLSWDNITSKGHFPALADEFVVWGKTMAEEFRSYYHIKEEKMHLAGVPHFDEHYEAKKNPNLKVVEHLGLNSQLPYLFFAMSSPYFTPYEIEIVEWLAEAVNKDEFGEEMQLIVRPHPQNVQGNMADKTWLPRLRRIEGGKVAVDYPQLVDSKLKWSMKQSDMKKLSDLLVNCSICLNSGSTISIDTLIVDQPVIITAFDAHKKLSYWDSARRLIDFVHLRKLVDSGGISVVENFRALKKEIFAYLSDADRNKNARMYAKKMQVEFSDGKATERVAKILTTLLEKTELDN